MGITRGLLRSVFSKNRFASTHETNERDTAVDKRRWSAVRLYLCGDEFSPAVAEEDSAAVKSSEATVMQAWDDGSSGKETTLHGATMTEGLTTEKQNSASNLLHEEDAARIIQSAFRSFRIRRCNQEAKLRDKVQELDLQTQSPTPSRDSVCTSIEVQTGNSMDVLLVKEGSMVVERQLQKKPRVQILKLKEDWDDSTVSSSISKLRLQNKLEATNRRERALAYAFAQQLRICSKKRESRSEDAESNISWSWLERWMATRLPECSTENRTGKQPEPTKNFGRVNVHKKLIDVAAEEKESCGSNEISVQLESMSLTSAKAKEGLKPSKKGANRLKARRAIPRQKTVPSFHSSKENAKMQKKGCSKETEQDQENKPNHQCTEKEVRRMDGSP